MVVYNFLDQLEMSMFHEVKQQWNLWEVFIPDSVDICPDVLQLLSQKLYESSSKQARSLETGKLF